LAIPPRFDPSPLTDSERQGWLAWSLPFFTDPTHPQNPHLSITLPLEVSAALRRHRAGEVRRADWDAYNLGVVVGNLPNLPFTGFSLHSHGGDAAGRCVFYVGQRSERDGVTTMPPPIPTFSTSCWPTGATAISTTCPHDWDLRVAVHALHHLGKKGLIKIAAED